MKYAQHLQTNLTSALCGPLKVCFFMLQLLLVCYKELPLTNSTRSSSSEICSSGPFRAVLSTLCGVFVQLAESHVLPEYRLVCVNMETGIRDSERAICKLNITKLHYAAAPLCGRRLHECHFVLSISVGSEEACRNAIVLDKRQIYQTNSFMRLISAVETFFLCRQTNRVFIRV